MLNRTARGPGAAPSRLAAAATFFGLGMGQTKPEAKADNPAEDTNPAEPEVTAAAPAAPKDDPEPVAAAADADPEDDDEDDETEMKGNKPAARARARERARCAAIFSHTNAAANPDFAGKLAFTTTIGTAEALALMDATSAGGSTLSTRMDAVKQPDLGPGGQPAGGAQATASAWDSATKKFNTR